MTLEHFTGQIQFEGVLRTIRRSVTSPHPHEMPKKNTKKTIENKVKRSESWPNIQTPLSG